MHISTRVGQRSDETMMFSIKESELSKGIFIRIVFSIEMFISVLLKSVKVRL
jgi:hypothetical protein